MCHVVLFSCYFSKTLVCTVIICQNTGLRSDRAQVPSTASRQDLLAGGW